MTRNRWDDMRTLIEAGWHGGWGKVYPTVCDCGTICKERRDCRYRIDWDDIKRAEADADRMLYGGMFTPQRED